MAYLSMNDVLDELILQEKNVFTLGDAARIMHKDNGYVSRMLAQTAYNDSEEWLDQFLEYLKSNLEFLKDFIKKNIPDVKVIEPDPE